ncbi:hypothetical protein CRG98_043864 [Punica granatum]|uniref:WPP domain-interacting protein 2 n=1 Tax=Punica granatum TaxID=22663 RepID=A0A2I0HWR3_PUNGR|nr:hypothetical protein CRG98_043864 [Punica granatum]
MDLGSQCSVHESVEENELTPERVPQADHNTATSNCSGSYKEKLSSGNECATPAAGNEILPDSTAGKDSKAGEPVNSPPCTAKSPDGVTPPTAKGYGLKKWRRIRRDFQKDPNATADSNKALKRVLPAPANPSKIFHNSEALVGSTSGMRYDGSADGSAARSSSLNSRFAAVPTFVAGADSDNSEDRSSKSSTAASFPKFKSELPSGSGHALEKNRIKNVIGKISSGSAKGAQQGKGRVESSKKQRGERIKIEKENSHSSVESDSRSSNFVFTQANFSATSNGKKSGIYDGECSDDAEECGPQFSEEVQTAYSKQNSGDYDDRSQDDSVAEMPWKAEKEKRENHHSSVDRDPLVESILSLQSVQESLERELQKFADIGKEPGSPPSANGSSPQHEQLDPELINQIPSSFLEIQMLTLTENIKNLEAKLEEARATVQAKEAQVSELEAALNLSKLPKEEPGSGEAESEIEGLFRQKIEAEIEYLAITRTIQKLRVEEQQSLADIQSNMITKLGKVEAKATELKKQAEEEAYKNLVSADLKGVDEVLTFQNRACKASFFLILQLVLLLVVDPYFSSYSSLSISGDTDQLIDDPIIFLQLRGGAQARATVSANPSIALVLGGLNRPPSPILVHSQLRLSLTWTGFEELKAVGLLIEQKELWRRMRR